MRNFTKTQKLTTASLLLAVGIILPFATSHGVGIPGTVLLPMHIPVFLAGLLQGPLLGALIGLILPPLNSVLTGMPVIFPMMPIMTAELFTYGLVSGLVFHKTPFRGTRSGVYLSILAAMAAGRAAYGIVFGLLLLVREHRALSVTAALITGIPGIILQFILVPAVVFAVGNIKMKENMLKSAEKLIEEGKLSLAVIKDGQMQAAYARGITPLIEMYERGALSGAEVVDKIVGMAAAKIMVLGGVKHCTGLTMNRSALEYLKKNGISVEYRVLAEQIQNRDGTGPCPMEEAVEGIDDPAAALSAVRAKLAELNSKKKTKE